MVAFILEVVKLEVGNTSRKEEAHIAGTKHILLNYTVCERIVRGWHRPMRRLAKVLQRPSHLSV